MRSFLASEDVMVAVPLTRNGEPFVPDAGQINWELRGHDGAVLSPATSETGIVDTEVVVTIPAAHNTITADTEKRTLIVTGAVEGRPFSIQAPYRLTGFLNMTASADEVRSFIGISAGELADEEVDLEGAYFDIGDLITTAALAAALAGSSKLERAANKAIIAQAVINLLPSLPARISKKETDGANTIERFEIDYAALERRAVQERDKQLAVSNPVISTVVAKNLVSVTQRPDPLTGA